MFRTCCDNVHTEPRRWPRQATVPRRRRVARCAVRGLQTTRRVLGRFTHRFMRFGSKLCVRQFGIYSHQYVSVV